MVDKSLVSIIALNYNQSDFLIESLEAIALQSYKNIELIITDDCSTDDSIEKIDAWVERNPQIQVIKVYNKINLGLCKTLNKAIHVSKGYYIKPIACDDIILPEYLERVTAEFNNETDLIFTDMILMNEKGEIRQASNYKYNRVNPADYLNNSESLLEAQYIAAPTIIYKRSLFNQLEGYDESLAYEDWDFLLKAQKKTKFSFIDQALVKYRVHEKNMHKSLRNNSAFVDSTIRILLREVATSENLKIKENLSAEICKMLIINELEGLRYFELFKNRYQRVNATDPVISVLITSYNTAEFILPCITTILLQTFQNIEVIVIDDGSTDKTLEILGTIRDSRLKVFALSENKGRVEALNYGLSLCTGQYLALMDSDDLASPLRIEKLYEHLQKNQLDAVSSQFYEYKNNSDFTISSFRTDEKAIKVTMLFYNAVPHAATLFKSQTIQSISYRDGFDYAEDYDMMARYSLHYKLGMINEPLYLYRRRNNSATGITNSEHSLSSQKKIIREIFDLYLFTVTETELDLHFDMLTSIRNPVLKDMNILIQIRSWIYKIISKNKHRIFFNEKALKRILLDNYWSVYYYANIKNHNTKAAIRMFTMEDIELSFLIFKEGLKSDVKKLLGKNN